MSWRAAVSLCLLAVPAAAAAQTPPLVQAARAGDRQAVAALLSSGTPPDAREGDGATALHWAVHRDDAALVALLLEAGAGAGVANDLGVTPLQLACQNGSAVVVRRLLDAGASPAAPSQVPPLVECARTGRVATVESLLAAGAAADVREPVRGQTPLMTAAAQGHLDVARALLAAGADVRLRSTVTRVVVNRANPNDVLTAVVGEVSRGGSTPLLFAAREGSAAMGALLLAAGADVNEIAPDGTSALTMAVHGGHDALAGLLLDKGANPNVIGSGYTALHAAVLRGSLPMVEALLARGANVNARIQHGTTTTRGSREYFLPQALTGATPVLLAAKFLEPAILEALLQKGGDPRIALQDGTTVLMAAAGVGSQPNLFDRRDRLVLRPPDEAATRAVVERVLALPGDVNAANAAGETALHGASRMNHPSVVGLLVTRGARLDARNRKGETPMAVAGGDESRAALRAAGARD